MSKKRSVFTEEINNTALNSNDNKTMQSIDLVATCAYGTSKELICSKEKIKRYNIIKHYKNV